MSDINDESSISSTSENGEANNGEALRSDVQVLVENGADRPGPHTDGTNAKAKGAAAPKPAKSKAKKKSKSSGSSVASASSAATPSPSIGTKNSSAKKNHGVPYVEYVHDAIASLKDRTGSSQVAIYKQVLEKHPDLDPLKFKGRISRTLKLGVKSERFIKIKSSYKINPSYKGRKRNRQSASAKKKTASSASSNASVSSKGSSKKLTPSAKKEAEKAAAAEKERKERIRRRRFPMDDLKLIAEDKELKVSVSLPSRPSMSLALPDFPLASRSDTAVGGVWEDALFCYSFFRGDMGWARILENPTKKGQIPLYLVAPFNLSHWINAVEEILRGNAKKSRIVPPLISHAFVVALQAACRERFPKLYDAISPGSWSEILVLYMDAMQRYMTTSTSVENSPDEIKSAYPIDTNFLLGATAKCQPGSSASETPQPLPLEPGTYITHGPMYRAHDKLFNIDAWMLSAEELMSLLRALVDDLIGNLPEIQEEIEVRLSEVHELLKKKRFADAHFRKVNTAYNRQNGATAQSAKNNGEDNEKGDPEPENGGNNGKKAVGSKVTEKQVEAARKQQYNANYAYEKACRFRVARSEPIGYDRNFNAFYHFAHDPEQVYVRLRGPIVKLSASSKWTAPSEYRTYKTIWHKITHRSTLDSYVESLDVRGRREFALAEALKNIRRHLVDDVKELIDQKARAREREELQRKLDNAKKKCELGRKSGRLAGKAEVELNEIEAQIEQFEKEDQKKPVDDILAAAVIDWYDATGLNALAKFDSTDIRQQYLNQRKRATRRDAAKQEVELQKVAEQEDQFTKHQCSHLLATGRMDGTGIVGLIVKDLTYIEEACEEFVPWPATDRSKWLSSLELAVSSWHVANPPSLGPAIDGDDGQPTNKKAKIEDEAGMSIQQIMAALRRCLVTLEERFFVISGLSVASQDLDLVEEDADEESVLSIGRSNMDVEVGPDQWKKDLCLLRHFKPSTRVRGVLIQAIDHARKAGLIDVVALLGSAMLLYHPDAAGAAKSAALEVLDKYGGYEEADEGLDDDDDNDSDDEDDEKAEDFANAGLSPTLSFEADVLNGSLDGHEDAKRSDWIDAVKKSKTMAKLASLAAAFRHKASDKIEKMEIEKSNMDDILKTTAERKRKAMANEKPEVWTEVTYTDNLCWSQTEAYPWWPARRCVAKNTDVQSVLKSIDRELVSLLGEEGALRMIPSNQIVDYSQGVEDVDLDISKFSKELRSQLRDCLKIASRLSEMKTR